MTISLTTEPDRSVAAGEYVLGTLNDADRDAFERTLATSPALRADVAFWQDRLLALTQQAAPADLPPALWPRIEQRLAPPRAPVARSTAALAWWRGLGLAALAGCALLASVLVWRPLASPAVERYVAVLQVPGGGGNGWVVEVQTQAGAGGTLRLVPVHGTPPVPAGRSLQFWTKAPGAAGPSSLGLVPAGGPAELPTSRLPALMPEQLFEITLEPEGGSPIGRPTGPVLFIGRAVRLSS